MSTETLSEDVQMLLDGLEVESIVELRRIVDLGRKFTTDAVRCVHVRHWFAAAGNMHETDECLLCDLLSGAERVDEGLLGVPLS